MVQQFIEFGAEIPSSALHSAGIGRNMKLFRYILTSSREPFRFNANSSMNAEMISILSELGVRLTIYSHALICEELIDQDGLWLFEGLPKHMIWYYLTKKNFLVGCMLLWLWVCIMIRLSLHSKMSSLIVTFILKSLMLKEMLNPISKNMTLLSVS
jgi:hypothetical protein